MARVRVRNAAGVSAQVAVRPCAPRLLTWTRDGKGEATLLHPDYRLVSEAAPAPPGGVVMLYLLGLGAVTPPVAAGARAGDGQRAPLSETDVTPTVWIGSAQAEVLWAGLAPNFAGLYQLNIRMPQFLPEGRHGITVAVGGETSQAEVWVAGGASVWRSVGTAAIAPRGGTVSGAGLELALAAGAVSSEAEIRISAPSVGVGPSGALATGVWKVSGLPVETAAPLTLRLPLASGEAPAGNALVLVKSEGEPDAGLALLRATIRDGRLEATLPATAANAGPQQKSQREALIVPEHFTATVWGMAGFSPIESPAGKFTVWVPRGDDRDFEAAEATGRILEEALQKLKAIGIDTDGRRATPIDVYLFPFSALPANLFLLDDELNGMTESEVWGRDDMGLTLNLNAYRNNREASRITAGHELFHLFQSYYDPRRWAQRTFLGASWLWMWEAASTWFEQKMSSAVAAYLADTTRTNADFLFRGGLEALPGPLSSG
ncbi:MAG: hypothetical protein HXY18_02310 [Bryobacteraceae bacterium]|nr:hypothetical protein [Bryobacteraceae bacterium]